MPTVRAVAADPLTRDPPLGPMPASALLLHGERDLSTPLDVGAASSADLPGSQLVVVPAPGTRCSRAPPATRRERWRDFSWRAEAGGVSLPRRAGQDGGMSTPTKLPSYTSATSDVPLLGETIGANLERTVARWGDREALVDVRPRGGGRTTSWTSRSTSSPSACWSWVSARVTASASGAPNCAEWVLLQYATAKIGAILVNVNPATASTSWRTC